MDKNRIWKIAGLVAVLVVVGSVFVGVASANHPPTASRENPSSSEVTIKVGDTVNFEISAYDVDGNLRGAEWYLDGAHQVSLFEMSGYDDTDDWSHTFNNEGDYLVEGQAFDSESAYSDPVSWTVHVEELSSYETIEFSGYTWDVRLGSESPQGPGNNYWSNSTENIWLDEEGQLHLKITYRNGKWYCPEIYSQESFGYGKYYFFVSSRVDELDKNVVGGLFTYLDDNNEIDIEFSKWGEDNADNSQYVVQPYYHAGNTHRFNMQLNGDYSTHCIDWHQNYINFLSLHGHYHTPPDSGYIIDEWEYTGVDIPATSTEKVHLNLWLMNGNPPSDGQSAEMIIKKFEFVSPSEENIFDTRVSANPYPSISGTHTGTITPDQDITVQKLYTYPCAGTGGHTESVRIYGNEIDKSASWNGYVEDWHNITFDSSFTLEADKTYNYVIETGSYPQIHHTGVLPTTNGWMNCTEFTDANGKKYGDWIPAILLT